MGVVGWVLIVVGVIAIILGMVLGAKDAFSKQNEPGAEATLPTAFLEVLKKLLEATPSKMFFVGGILLVGIGAVLNGIDVFSGS